MKLVAYVIAMVFFLGGLALFGFAFQFTGFEAITFFAGIIAVCVALAIPVHLMKRLER